jgi:hypothetical protein
MKKSSIHKLLENTPRAKTKKVLEDLQYNLTVFLNEDVYLDHFEEAESLFWVDFFEKNGMIFITETEERLLLTPAGQTILNEINSLLLYLD